MHKIRWLVFPVLLIFLLGCGLLSGVQNIQKTVSTQLPEILTSAPTAQGMIETIAAQQSLPIHVRVHRQLVDWAFRWRMPGPYFK